MPGLKTTPDYAQRAQNIHPFDLDRSGITDGSVTMLDVDEDLNEALSSATSVMDSVSSLSADVVSLSASSVYTKNYNNSITSNYVALTGDDTIIAQTISGDIIISLPKSTTFMDAHIFNIKKEGTVGLVKIIPFSGDNVEGSLTAFITSDKTCITIQTDIVNKWRII